MRAVFWLAVLLTWDAPAFALNPSLSISQYTHTAWTIGEGFLDSRVLSIAQTPDGYLWLGTEAGLFRFDGVKISRWQPDGQVQLPGQTVSTLLVTRDGHLWIGTASGLARWKDGRLVTYPEFQGHVVTSLIEDSQGTVWVGTMALPTAHLCAIRDIVQCVPGEQRLGNAVFTLHEARGALWVGAATGLWRWGSGEPTRYALPARTSDLITLDSGNLLVAMYGALAELVSDRVEPYPLSGVNQPFDALKLLRDRDGGLWIATGRQGLVHVSQGRTDIFTPADGLSGDSISALFEDREGNIWIGTNEGLDRFRERPVTTISRKQGLPTNAALAVLPTRDGSVWISSPDGLTRWQHGQTTTYRTGEGLPDVHVTTLFQESTGRVLASTTGGMAVFDGNRFGKLLRSDPTRVVYNIVEERPGRLWVSDANQGLLHIAGDVIVGHMPWSALGRDDHATTMVLDRSGRGLWLGFYKGGVQLVQDGRVRASYGEADGLGPGRVSELRLDDDGTLWAATDGGLSRIRDNRVATLTTKNGLPCDALHWTLADAARSLWSLTSCGLVRISQADMAAWVADPTRTVTATLLESADGVRTQSTAIGMTPTAVRLPDGRLWFATPNGVGIVDPEHLPVNTLPPPVHIERLVADRRPYATPIFGDGNIQLPPGVHDLQIDYTALSLVAPEKVRFRYQLEGVDRGWQDVGNRRQAFYTDLDPGQYRFRVTAANNSGVWNEDGVALAFAIAPAYFQTAWFQVLCAGMVVALLSGLHRIRLRIVETHQREISALNERLMKAQEQERIRIAGELHDGVMQQMLAATMMLGTVKRRMDNREEAAAIDKVQAKLIEAGTDIRHLSHELHPPVLEEAGLPKAIELYCEEFAAAHDIRVGCSVDQAAQDLSRGSALALFRIVQEALGNAAKHARPQRITVRLRRVADVVSLVISDDGPGFAPLWRSTGASGGLGLLMMRERATQLNGTFEFDTAPGRGTRITVTIPFR